MINKIKFDREAFEGHLYTIKTEEEFLDYILQLNKGELALFTLKMFRQVNHCKQLVKTLRKDLSSSKEKDETIKMLIGEMVDQFDWD